ncbi:hypothetical protein [Paraburkholderia azotifigens]|uniref:Uncharacterized protein n=1 Tax=Paraburkholderia azotifigens TaxID=2057004 RepID=A0ABU9R327_9BURK
MSRLKFDWLYASKTGAADAVVRVPIPFAYRRNGALHVSLAVRVSTLVSTKEALEGHHVLHYQQRDMWCGLLKFVNFASAFNVFFDSASTAIERHDGLAGAGRGLAEYRQCLMRSHDSSRIWGADEKWRNGGYLGCYVADFDDPHVDVRNRIPRSAFSTLPDSECASSIERRASKIDGHPLASL